MSINPSIRIEQVQRLRALADAMKDIPDNASTMDDLESWLKHHAMAEAAQNNIDTQGAYLKAVKDRLIASLAENRRKLDKALDARLRKILGGHTGSALEQEMKKFAALSGAIPAGLSVSNPVAEVIERNLLQKESEFHKADILDVAVKSTASENSLGELRRRLANELALLQQQRTRKLLFIAGGVILASLIFFIMAFVVYAKKQCAPATYLQHSFCASLPDTIAVRPTGTPTVAPTSKPTLPPTQTPTSTSTHTPTAAPTATSSPTPTASPTPIPTPTPTPVTGQLSCNLIFKRNTFGTNIPQKVPSATIKISWKDLKLDQDDLDNCNIYEDTDELVGHSWKLTPVDGAQWPDSLQTSGVAKLTQSTVGANDWQLTLPLDVKGTSQPGELNLQLSYAIDEATWEPVEGVTFILKWEKISIAPPTPTATPKPKRVVVDLLTPKNNAEVTGNTTFSWEPENGSSLPDNQFYEAVFFTCSEDPDTNSYGFADATKETSINVNLVALDDIFGGVLNNTPTDFQSGTWCWTVFVGHFQGQDWIRDYQAAQKNKFTYTRPGGSSDTNKETGE